MTNMLFREDAYMRDAIADVVEHTAEGGIVLDSSIFYPTGGGQPGDSGVIAWAGSEMTIATTLKGEGDQIVLVPAEPSNLPPVGTTVDTSLDWDRRFGHMRMHSALHLLSVVMPYGVTGGSIGAGRGRLDFDMEDAPTEGDMIEEALNALVSADMRISESWITDAELAATPSLVKTLSVQPPRGQDRIRLVRIGEGDATIDLQPCGGTHVARTGEIGALKLGKIEKKGRKNRRVYLHFDI
ncbi:alanyl-tRNA editing protein [Tateyamaria pelophila]|uniref:alanyl-tRNA editing protein n=1 Tax=Tateyamaria pelophila TaxID=328415 RepID=UPI001CBF53C7|nr:alanyl-tRNA editing protein [Tateyamaria pelophila]